MLKRAMVVMAVAAVVGFGFYAAAELVESFEFKFDTKDSIEGWVANGDSKAEWKEGGAGESAGCMKIAGDHTSADSPLTSFKCGENVISFDYYVHDTSTCRVRFSVAGAENRTKYGRYGNLVIRKVEPDGWRHAEAKLIDLPGMAEENKAKAWADLAFDRFGFSTTEKVEDGGYIMIDNVKMGKPAAPAAPAPPAAE